MEIVNSRIQSEHFEYYTTLPQCVTPGLLAKQDTTIKSVPLYISGDRIKTKSLSLGLPLSNLELSRQGLLDRFNGDVNIIPAKIELFKEQDVIRLSQILPREELEEIRDLEIVLKQKFGNSYRFRRN